MALKIYFAGAIRSGRNDAKIYREIIAHLKNYGEVLTAHVGDKHLSTLGETELSDQYIHNRDLEWIVSSDFVIAEVSTPSSGVGYEIGAAEGYDKKILALYRPQAGKKLSAVVAGSPETVTKEYRNFGEAKRIIDGFFLLHGIILENANLGQLKDVSDSLNQMRQKHKIFQLPFPKNIKDKINNTRDLPPKTGAIIVPKLTDSPLIFSKELNFIGYTLRFGDAGCCINYQYSKVESVPREQSELTRLVRDILVSQYNDAEI